MTSPRPQLPATLQEDAQSLGSQFLLRVQGLTFRLTTARVPPMPLPVPSGSHTDRSVAILVIRHGEPWKRGEAAL